MKARLAGAWICWALTFVVVEGLATFDSDPNDTITEYRFSGT